MKALLDTCVIIDALQSRKPFAEDAQRVFLAAASDQCAAFISAKAATDIYYLTHHALHSKNATEQIMEKLFHLFGVLDTTAGDVLHGMVLPLPDYEDAVMLSTAMRTKMDCLVTRNIRDYKNAEFRIYTPAEFLKIIGYQDPDEPKSSGV